MRGHPSNIPTKTPVSPGEDVVLMLKCLGVDAAASVPVTRGICDFCVEKSFV